VGKSVGEKTGIKKAGRLIDGINGTPDGRGYETGSTHIRSEPRNRKSYRTRGKNPGRYHESHQRSGMRSIRKSDCKKQTLLVTSQWKGKSRSLSGVIH